MPRSRFASLLLILSFFCSIKPSQAQTAAFPTRIVLQNGDTVHTTILVQLNLFWRKVIDERSVTNGGITVYDSLTDKRRNIYTKTLKEIRFTDPKGKERMFVNFENRLEEVMFDGKIRWMRYFTSHPYDGGIVAHDYLLDEQGVKTNMGLFFNNRKRLKEALAARPDLVTEISYMKMTNENLLLILEKYNEG